MSTGIAVMAKASLAGRVKTRLVPPLTPAEAAAFNTAFIEDAAANLLAAGALAEVRGYVAYAARGTEAFFEAVLPAGIGLLAPREPGFGAGLFNAAQDMLAAGHGAACLLNADGPTLPTAFLVAAAEALATAGDRVVLGPAEDGGYYLIGLKRPHQRLFEDVAWSTERVFGQTLERAEELGLEVVTLPAWYDVDDIGGLRRLAADVLRDPSPAAEATPFPAPRTALRLRRLLAEGAGPRLGLTGAAEPAGA